MDYQPQKGYYDLSLKPETLSKSEHRTLQKNQIWLMNYENSDYQINDNLVKEISAKIQQQILEHCEREPEPIAKNGQMNLF